MLIRNNILNHMYHSHHLSHTHTHIHMLFIRKELMLDLMKLALRDVEENYETFIDNQRKAYQRG